jgi:hypothetical protein
MQDAIQLEPSATESILEFVENLNFQSPYLDLKQITEHIKEGFLGYVKAGICLEKVQYLKLWKQKFRSFKEYCESALGKTLSYAKRIMEAARVCEQLILGGFEILPVCEAQARPLVKFASIDPTGHSELAEKWQQVLDASGGKITAELVKAVVDGESVKAGGVKMQVDRDIYDALEAKAKMAGLTPQQLLKKLVEGHIPDELEPAVDTESQPEEEDRIEPTFAELIRWEEDLLKLVEENHESEKTNRTLADRYKNVDDS